MGRQIQKIEQRKLAIITSAVLLCAALLTACGSHSARRTDSTDSVPESFGSPRNNSSSQAQTQNAGQEQILQAQAAGARKTELLFTARVRKLLPDDTKGLPHQLFLLQLSNGTTVKVAHDIKYAPRVPIQEGDLVTIKGEYIWNSKGGVVHWTHHSDTPRHEGGYIEFAGNRYE